MPILNRGLWHWLEESVRALARADTGEPPTQVLRIGVITSPLGAEDTPALRFLILHLNTLQQSFQFELFPGMPSNPLLRKLASRILVDRDDARARMAAFVEQIKADIKRRNEDFQKHSPQLPLEAPPEKFVILSMTRFHDNFYSARVPDEAPVCAIIALGNWKRSMAPPTIVEFFLVLLLRQAVALASPSLSGSVHLGTKGCLFDLGEDLSDTRYKVLGGFVCDYCAKALSRDGHPALRQELTTILAKAWFGSPDKPSVVASIASNLGHNLFITKGLKPNFWESIRSTFRQETVKQLLTVLGTVLASALIFYLGFRSAH